MLHNNNEVKHLFYDNQKVKKWYHNGVRVFTAGAIVTYIVDTDLSYTEEVDSGASCLNPTTFTPTKTGWEFVGWREDTVASSDVLTSKVVEDTPITLYAVFKQGVTVTYYNNSQTASTSLKDRLYNNTNISNPTFTLSQSAIVGWSKRGWSTSNVGNANITYQDGETFTRDSGITLYGLYQQTITLSYDGNGATSGSVNSQQGTRYFAPSGYINPTFVLANNSFAKTNYYFTGWSYGGSVYNVGDSITLSASATAYASWHINQYTVSYVYGGAVVYSAVYNHGDLITSYVPSPISGRTFLGWTNSSTGTTAQTLYATGNTTLYAISQVARNVTQNLINNSPAVISGNWTNNSNIVGYVRGKHNDEEGAGHLMITCDGTVLVTINIRAGMTEDATGTLNLGTKKSATLTLDSNPDNSIYEAYAYVSWNETVTG